MDEEGRNARSSSRLMGLPFAKRRSSVQAHMRPQPPPAATSFAAISSHSPKPPLVSPALSVPSPSGHENQHQTFQYTTAVEMEELARSDESDWVGRANLAKRDTSNTLVEQEIEGVREVRGEMEEGEGGKESRRKGESSDIGNGQVGKSETEEQAGG